MFGTKITRSSVRDVLNKTKDVVGNTYKQTKQLFGDIDTGVRAAKMIYSVAAPLISDLLGTDFDNVNKHIIKGLSGYEDIRSKVMESDEQLKNNYNTVVDNLQKQKIKIGL